MRKLFIAFLFACGTKSVAQEVVVKSFDYLQTDLTARTQEKLDANGNSCAVVKVDIPLEDVVFKGWVVETISTPGEYLVYMPEGATKITMQHKTLTPFTYEFEKPLTGKNTYRLVALIIRADSSKPVYKVIEVSEEIKDRYNKGVSLLAQNKNDEAIKLIQDAANAGYAPAQYKYAESLSEKESINWYEKAASQGYADAICALGDVYMQGKEVSRDAERAFKYFIEAIDLNSSKAMIHAGECYENGEGTPQDMGKAFWYYNKSAELGEISAYSKVAHCYWEGIGVKENMNDAFNWLVKGTEKGDTACCSELCEWYNPFPKSKYYVYGDRFLYDKEKAIELFSKAAEKGISSAQTIMGNHYYYDLFRKAYYNGNRSEAKKYLDEAFKWFHKSAKQGNKEAKESINDHEDYLSRLRLAEKGDVNAQISMGEQLIFEQDMHPSSLEYYRGYPVRDFQLGITWLKKAANQNSIYALMDLAYLYHHGYKYDDYFYGAFTIQQDLQEAIKYYTKAANLGCFKAHVELKELYSRLKDQKEMEFKWAYKAATFEISKIEPTSSLNVFIYSRDNSSPKTLLGYAQKDLAMMYYSKELRNKKECIKWLRKAEANGIDVKYWLESAERL